ncbi:MAG TPA: helix-turn-helix transcriptional regulator [Polyangiaceae bacterium]|nr:helix-turn-helix transcriptional regulator [Polyangiaceae bacterium]
MAAHAAEAIRRIVAASLTSATDGQAGVILVAEERVIAITDASTIWLGADVKAGDPLPLSLRPVLRRLDAIENGTSSDLPAIRLVSSAGKLLEANAARLRGDGRTVAITVGPATARARSDVRLAAHDLTPAQRRVTSLVIQGRSTKQIVAELQIGEHTVQDHLKAVFDKLGVASRRELVASLLR